MMIVLYASFPVLAVCDWQEENIIKNKRGEKQL